MSERYNALVVSLQNDLRDDAAQGLIDAIRHLRGVLSVDGHVADIGAHTAEMRARAELGEKLLWVLYPGKDVRLKDG